MKEIQCPKCNALIQLDEAGGCTHCHYELTANDIVSSLFDDEFFKRLALDEKHPLREGYAYYFDGNLKKAEPLFSSVDKRDKTFIYAYFGRMLCISDGFEISFAPFEEPYQKMMQTILKQTKNQPEAAWLSFILNRYLMKNKALYDEQLAKIASLKQQQAAEINAKENELRSLELKKAAKIQKKREQLPALKWGVLIGIWLLSAVLFTWGFAAGKASYFTLIIAVLVPYTYCLALIPLISYANNEKKFYGFSLLLLVLLYPTYFAAMLIGMLIINDSTLFSLTIFQERLLIYAVILGISSFIQFIVFILNENKLHKKMVKYTPANSFDVSLDQSALTLCEAEALVMDKWLNFDKKENNYE